MRTEELGVGTATTASKEMMNPVLSLSLHVMYAIVTKMRESWEAEKTRKGDGKLTQELFGWTKKKKVYQEPSLQEPLRDGLGAAIFSCLLDSL